MKLAFLKPDDSLGALLVHNIPDAAGHKLLSKGHRIGPEDVANLRALGRPVYCARLEPGDVIENEAAARIAAAAAGENVSPLPAASGRVNLLATARGVLHVDPEALARINALQGVTLATRPALRLVQARKIAATVKTIGLAVAEAIVAEAEQIGREVGGIVRLFPLHPARVAIVLAGSPEARERVVRTFREPIVARVEELGGRVISADYVIEDSTAIAAAIARASDVADCVIIAGETSIMDREDVTPRGITQAGGALEVYGAPVDPGNLLLLAYRGTTPILGAPGCIRSRETNVVDLILPRLFSGEHVSRADVAAMANGGLLL